MEIPRQMTGLFRKSSPPIELTVLQENVSALESEIQSLGKDAKLLREQAKGLETDWGLLLQAASCLRPGISRWVLAEVLRGVAFRRLHLASLYLTIVDWERDMLHSVYCHEAGRAREYPSRRLSDRPGLSGRVILDGQPIYTRNLDEAGNLGVIFNEAAIKSGLIPQSFYGIPMSCGERPFGMVGFLGFSEDAFPEPTRRLMDALAGLMTLAMAGSQEPLDPLSRY